MLFQVQSLVDKESRDVKKTVLSEFKQAKKDADAKIREWKKANSRYEQDMKAGIQSAMMSNLDRQDKVAEATCRAQQRVMGCCSPVATEFFCAKFYGFLDFQTPSTPLNTTQPVPYRAKHYQNTLNAFKHH